LSEFRADAPWLETLRDMDRERLGALETEVAHLRLLVFAGLVAYVVITAWGLMR
jgi:hypothetical protein